MISDWSRVAVTIAEGTALAAALGVAFVGITWLGIQSGWSLFGTDYAARWTGACTGWTKPLALAHAAADYGYWSAYVTIALILKRHHPVISSLPTATLTMNLVLGVFTGCAFTHLCEAMTTFWPCYLWTAAVKWSWLLVSFAAVPFIAHALISIFRDAIRKQEKLARLEAGREA